MPIRNSRRSSDSMFSKRKLYLAMLACSSLAFPLDTLAGPEGGRITGGSGQITAGQKQTLIEQHSDRIAIDWDSFDLDADEIVSFLQPGASSVALNRILSDSASDIRGQINANGHVVLVNPRGIVFGESAQVNVGGMLASGLDIGVDDFMNGDFAFAELEGAEGVVINRGVIEASLGGSVGLIGKSVKNEGLITAELGSVVLAAGKQAVMTFDDEGLVGVRVTESVLQDELGVDPGVLNEGVIEARGGRVLLTAAASRDVFSQAVNSGSIEQARSVVMHDDGSFTLGAGSDVVNAGAIEVSGENSAGNVALLGENVTQDGEIFADSEHGRGGRVELTSRETTLLTRHSETQARSFSGGVGGDVLALGRQVGAEGGSLVEASGSEGGGHIYLGGDYRGENPWLLNAEKTVVQGEAQLKANATESGDGGRIIVWADDSTRFAGDIEGKGALDGAGGFAEVSGKRRLAYHGTAALSGGVAPGTLLLDPESLEVVGRGPDAGDENEDGDYEVDFTDPPGSDSAVFRITAETIGTQLSEGINVILEATESIMISEGIFSDTKSSDATLTLHSGGRILIAQNIEIGGAGLKAIAGYDNCDVECGGVDGGRSIHLIDETNISAGSISLKAFDDINLQGRSVSGQSIDLTARGDINVNSSLSASGGTINLIGGAGNAYIEDLRPLADARTGTLTITGSVDTTGSDVNLSASGAVTLSDAITTLGGNVYIGSDGNDVGSFDSYGDGSSVGSISTGGEQGSGIRNAGDIAIHSTGAVNLGNLSIAQDYVALDDNGGSESIGRIEVHSGETISLRTDFNFNNSGPFAWNGTGGMVNGEPLSMPELSFNAKKDINLRRRIYDEYVDARESLNVELRSTNGTVNLFNDIFSSGGNVTIDANRIEFRSKENGSVARIDTQNANLSQGEGDSRSDLRGGDWGDYLDGLEDGGGREHKRPSDGGHVELTAKESIDLGTVVTITQCEHFTAESCGNFTLSGRNDSLIEGEWDSTDVSISQLDGAELVIGGESVFRSGSAQVEVNRNNNQFMGPVSVLSGEDVSLYTASDIVLKGGDSLNAVRLHLEKSGDDGAVLQILEGNNAWTLSGANKGYITTDTITDSSDTNGFTFTGFTGLTGGSGQDTFTLLAGGSLTGAIEGGSGTSDRLSVIASEEQSLAWQLGADGDSSAITENSTARLGRFSGLEELVGSGEDTFTGRDQNTHWTLNAGIISDDGEQAQPAWTVAEQGEGALDSFVLTGVSRLNGGDGSDTFTLGAGYGFAGTLDGGGGLDSLAVNVANDSTGGSVWRLHHDATAEGSEAVRTLNAQEGDDPVRLGGFDGMETLIGSGADRFYGRDRNTGWRQNEDDTDEWFLTESTGDGGRYEGLKLLGMDELVGGSEDDTFYVENNVTDASVSLDGGSDGTDKLDLSGVESETLVQVGRIDDTQEANRQSNWLINNILTITGSNDNVTLRMPSGDNDWTITNKNTGSLVQAEPADGGDDNRLFTGTLWFSGIANLTGGYGRDEFNIEDEASLSGLLDGGAGNNNLDFSSWGEDGDQALAIGFGTDGFGWNLKGINEVTGNGENSTLGLAYGDNTWDITTVNGGTVTHQPGGDQEALFSGDLTFNNFGNLTGGAGADAFILHAEGDTEGAMRGSITGTIKGGGGADSLTVQGSPNQWTLGDSNGGSVANLTDATEIRVGKFEDIETLVGDGADHLQGRNANTDWVYSTANQWTLSDEGVNTASLFVLTGMSQVTGGSGDDDFTLATGANFGGKIDGGEGTNALTANGGPNQWYLDGRETGAVVARDNHDNVRLNSFTNLLEVNGGGTDVLVGRGEDTDWIYRSNDKWRLYEPNQTSNPLFVLTGMDKVTGGAGDDRFTLNADAHYLGTIDGGEGTNALTVNGGPNQWYLDGRETGAVVDRDSPDNVRLDAFTNILTLSGGEDNAVQGRNANTDWVYNTANEWTLFDEGNDTSSLFVLTGMSQVTGGSGNDDFTIEAEANYIGEIDGGEGTNALTVNGGPNQWYLDGRETGAVVDRDSPDNVRLNAFTNILTLSGGEDSAVQGRDASTDWVYSMDDEWTLFNESDDTSPLFVLTGMSQVTGGSGNDDFTVDAAANYIGEIDGGEGTNALTVNGGPNQWYLDGRETGAVVERGNPDNVRLNAFTNILTLSGGDDAVQGRDANTGWVYNTDNEWTLFNEDDDASPLFVLTGMAQVIGGAGEDAFTLNSDASYAGTINGGGGANSLSVDGGPSQWYLDGRDNGAVAERGNADNVRLNAFTNILTLSGGEGSAVQGRNANTDWVYSTSDEWTLFNEGDDTSPLFVLTGMSQVTGGTGDDDFTIETGANYAGHIDGGEGVSALTVNSGSGTGVNWNLDGQSTGGVDNRLTDFSNIATINGGDGNDTFTLTSSAQMATINGGNGTNTVVYSLADGEGDSEKASWTLTGYSAGNLQNANSKQSAFASIQSLTGSGHDDLTGPNSANHWRLSSEEGDSVGASGGAPEEALTFDGMANLTGGSQGDHFELTGDTVAFAGTIAGGSESGNRLTATQEGNQWRLTGTGTGNLENTLTFRAIQTLEGGTTGNTLFGPDRANLWTLSGTNSGRLADAADTDSITHFEGMHTLVGGSRADDFVVSGTGNLFAGMLNGGNAADNSTELDANDGVDLTARPANERITVGMDEALNADLTIVNIESIEANPDANVDDEGHRLIAPPEGTYQWTITGTNIGRVHPEGGVRADNTLVFDGFAFLTGSENNVFAFEGGNLTGGVTGGSGSNFLDYSSSEDDICFSMIGAFAGCDGMSIEGINGIIGNHTGAGAPNATLRAVGNGNYTWSIRKLNELEGSDGVNDGIFDLGGDNEIRFVNFNHLVGGGGNDRFNFVDNGEITGSVDGGGVSSNGRNVVDTTGSDYGFAFWQTQPASEVAGGSTLWMNNIGRVTTNAAHTNWLHGENRATTWTVTDTDSGYLGSEALLFQGVEHLVGGSGRDTFVIDVGGEVTGSVSGGGNINTLQVASQNDQGVDWQITGSQAGSVGNRVAAFTQVSELGGGDGDDAFTLNAAAQGVNINGGNGDNQVAYQLTDDEGEAQAATWSLTGAYAGTIRTPSGDANTFENIQALSGSDHDTLTGRNLATRWLIASAEGGSVGAETQQSDRYLTFTGMAELQGGTAADHFSIIENGRQFTGAIDGGANGGNRLSANSADHNWLLNSTGTGSLNNALTFSKIQTLAGGGEGNTLTGPDRNNRWTLSGEQRGNVAEQGVSATTTNFTGMDTLVGGTRNDLFVASDGLTLNHLSGFVLIDGGAQPADGGDALDLTALSDEGDVAVALEANADAHIVIAGLETLDALGNNNQLYGASDQGYTWRIDALNSGTLSSTATDSETPVSINFSGFANLTGGAASDTFAVVGDGSVDGQIDGGGGDGIDLVDYSGKSGAVDIVIGQANSDILGIEGVIGKSADGASTDVSRLRVADAETGKASWTIQRLTDVENSDGVNDGQVQVGNNQTFYFINFNTLEGGQGGSEFVLQGDGQLLGELIGGGGENTVITRNASLGHRFTLGVRGEQDTRLVNIDSVTANLDRTHRLIGAVGDNTWRVTEEGAGEIDNRLTFAGIDHLIGGDGQNDFILSGNGVVGRIEGTGPTADNTLTIAESVNQPLTASLDIESETADVRVSGLGELTGNSDGLRLEGDNRANLWVIDGDDSGTLNEALTFSGFATLLGNADTDRFELHGAGAISGAIDGAGGENTLDLFELADGRVLNLAKAEPAPGATPAADLVMLNIDTLSAPTDAGHTLIGGASDNQWQIDGENRGTLGALSFSGVANLIGGDAADTIEFLLGGSLSGYIDGRGGENTVDMSELSGEVAVTVGDDAGDLRHITHFVGNNTQTTLRALRESNSWRLADGDNAGTLNTTLSFEQVTDLVGGAGVDTFRLQGGRVTGLMDGAGGNDQFLVNLETGARGSQALRGGDGNDELRLSGGDANYRVDYSPRTNGDEQLSYTAGNGRVFDLTFSQLEQVQDNVLAETLTINTRLNPDTVVANNNRVQVSDLSTLNYTNKTNLTLAANTDDVVELAGALTVPGRLEIRNAEVTQSTDDALIARDLRLVSINEFGTAGAPIKTDIETLDADVGTGGIALRNADALSVTALRSLGDAQLSARGNLTSDADLSVAGDARWVSEQAGVRLEGLNRFSNTVDLRAAHDVQLNHDGALLLGDVQAKTFGLDNRGDVNQAEGEWTIDLLDLSVSGDVMAANDDNRIQGLRANSVGNLTLASDETLRLDGIDSDGQVIIRGRGLSVENRLNAGEVNLNALSGSLIVDRSVTADTMALNGERVVQNAELNSGGSLTINAADAIEQNARLAAVADIQLEAGGELTMSRSARTETDIGTIEYAAGGNLTIGYLDNSSGTVALRSDGQIQSVLDEQTIGLTAQRVELAARDGIGAGQTLALDTRELHATNHRGRIDLRNTGDLRIERLANNDDIVLVNRGTVTLDNRDGAVFDLTADDAVTAGGVTNANYDIGTVRFTVEEGDLLALGPVDGTRPDLVGRRGLFLVNGDIGSLARPLVMYFQESLIFQGLRSWQPIWAFNDAPDTFENNSVVKMGNEGLMGAGEQLVEVESLEDIDPGIFTAVRNYSFDDVSILLPPDQRYSDDDAEDERYSAY